MAVSKFKLRLDRARAKRLSIEPEFFVTPVGDGSGGNVNVTSRWTGAVTKSAIRVKAKVSAATQSIRLKLSKSADMSNPFFGPFGIAAASPTYTQITADTITPVAAGANVSTGNIIADLCATGLDPATRYWYQIESGGVANATIGSFRTFPAGVGSFRMAFGSCANAGANGGTFVDLNADDQITQYVNLGDFYYSDLPQERYAAQNGFYDQLFNLSNQAAVCRNRSTIYMYDDHDFGPDNASENSPTKPAAWRVYRERVPHYRLPVVEGSAQQFPPLCQAWTAGRIRFILTDNRCNRNTYSTTDSPTKTVLGSEQKAWFKQEVLNAKSAGLVPVWFNPGPSHLLSGTEGWFKYTYERGEIHKFIKDNGVFAFFELAGDVHCGCIDNGANNWYASPATPTEFSCWPIVTSSGLQRDGNASSTVYSHGQIAGSATNSGIWATLDIVDDGTFIKIIGTIKKSSPTQSFSVEDALKTWIYASASESINDLFGEVIPSGVSTRATNFGYDGAWHTLKNFRDGSSLSLQVKGDTLSPDSTSRGSLPASPLTQCFDAFKDKTNAAAAVGYPVGTTAQFIRFQGLNPAKKYLVTLSENRGIVGDTTSVTKFTIDAIDARNESGLPGSTSVSFNTGNNSEGNVARWVFTPKPDGAASVAFEADQAFSASAFAPRWLQLSELV